LSLTIKVETEIVLFRNNHAFSKPIFAQFLAIKRKLSLQKELPKMVFKFFHENWKKKKHFREYVFRPG